jgi:hypothetical protein
LQCRAVGFSSLFTGWYRNNMGILPARIISCVNYWNNFCVSVFVFVLKGLVQTNKIFRPFLNLLTLNLIKINL